MATRGAVDVVAHLVLRQLAAVVLVTRQTVEALAPVDELAELEHEQPRPLSVGKKDGEALGPLDHSLELANLRVLIDDQLVAHRHRQVQRLPEVARDAREKRKSARVRTVEATPDMVLDALQRPMGTLADGTGHTLELELVIVRPDVAAAVDVEIAGHHWA